MSKIIKKINNLLAKAEGTDNEHESELFMAKVHELLEAHQLELSDLGTLDTEDPVIHDKEGVKVSKVYSWSKTLMTAISRYYGCRIVWQTHRSFIHYDVFGRESAVATFHAMQPYIFRAVKRKSRELVNEEKVTTIAKGNTAVANAMAARLNRLTRDKPQSLENGYNALVPVNQIDELMDKIYPDANSKMLKGNKTNLAARMAANSISLNAQASGKNKTLQIGNG